MKKQNYAPVTDNMGSDQIEAQMIQYLLWDKECYCCWWNKNKEIEIEKELKVLRSLVLNSSGNVKRRFALANSAFLRLKKVYGHAETSL